MTTQLDLPTQMSSDPAKTGSITPAEIKAAEAVLAEIDRKNLSEATISYTSNWFLGLNLFKKFEVHYLMLEDKSRFGQQHKSILSLLMGLGELILAEIESRRDIDFKNTGYAIEDVRANVKYLRDKYAEWDLPLDDREAGKILHDVFGSESIDDAPEQDTRPQVSLLQNDL